MTQTEHDYEKDTTMRCSSELLDELDEIESRSETHEACVWRLIDEAGYEQ